MKVRKRWMAVMALLLAGGAWMEPAAQETIDALVKKCESLDKVKVNIVRNRDPETKEVTRSIVSILIPLQSHQALIDGFVAAFQKEKENAEQELENRENGKLISLFYRFEKKSYSLSMNNGEAVVSIIENDRARSDRKKKEQEKMKKKEEQQRE
ncbi:MAG: DUF5024 domain-containing protein [Tannerella sp.]|jgi:hypothetical protein|nr:DUF5024 domain-containing protein [Tannerella sp.]